MKILVIIAIYLALMNAAAFLAFGIDKRRARHNRWRIPEATLLLLAFLGGSLGAHAGMEVFHHKTRHRKFSILIPMFIVLHVGIAIYLIFLRMS